MANEKPEITYDDWVKKGIELFGEDTNEWQFVCPACKHIAKVRDWFDAGADEGAVAFSCIGRYTGAKDGDEKPCNYAGGGLFRLNPIKVIMLNGTRRETFEFATP